MYGGYCSFDIKSTDIFSYNMDVEKKSKIIQKYS